MSFVMFIFGMVAIEVVYEVRIGIILSLEL